MAWRDDSPATWHDKSHVESRLNVNLLLLCLLTTHFSAVQNILSCILDTISMSPQATSEKYSRRSLVIPASTPAHGHLPSVRKPGYTPLRLSVHDYHVHCSTKIGLTIILTHGTSFNKYFWELIINYMLSQPGANGRFKRFIALDAANHGDSALLNQGSLPRNGMYR